MINYTYIGEQADMTKDQQKLILDIQHKLQLQHELDNPDDPENILIQKLQHRYVPKAQREVK